MDKDKLLALLETQRIAAREYVNASVSGDWWRGYEAALYWIIKEVQKDEE